MNSTDQAVRNIGMIWDNDEATHMFIVESVRFSSSWMEVSSKLQMFYNKSIDYVLSEFSSRLIGVQVIAEQVNYHSRDVFDELARGYWRDMKEMSA
jgi:hypothetical protein|tara:strand:- start:528 stop:815 length:288 start_codon:yes stop_codon:yes gene_type:complete